MAEDCGQLSVQTDGILNVELKCNTGTAYTVEMRRVADGFQYRARSSRRHHEQDDVRNCWAMGPAKVDGNWQHIAIYLGTRDREPVGNVSCSDQIIC